MSLAILGDQDSGKTVFLGLLYQTMKVTTGAAKDEFRYIQTKHMADLVEEIEGAMTTGHWPAGTEGGDPNDFRFLLGYDISEMEMYENIRHRLNNFIFRWGDYGDFGCHMAYMLDIAGETVQDFADDVNYLDTYELDPTLRQVFDSDIIVLLIDTKRFTESKGLKNQSLSTYDWTMTKVITGYTQYRSKKRKEQGKSGKKKLYPFVFFTKLDDLENGIVQHYKTEHSLDIPELTNYEPGAYKPSKKDPFPGREFYKERSESYQTLGELLMSRYMSNTHSQLLGSRLVGIDLAEPLYFYSWMNSIGPTEPSSVEEEDKDVDLDIDIYRDDYGITNVYPIHIYQAFLSKLRTMFGEVIDPPSRYENLYESGSEVEW